MPKQTKQKKKQAQGKRKKAGAKEQPRFGERVRRANQSRDAQTHFRQSRDQVNQQYLLNFGNVPVINPVVPPQVPILVEHNSPIMKRRNL